MRSCSMVFLLKRLDAVGKETAISAANRMARSNGKTPASEGGRYKILPEIEKVSAAGAVFADGFVHQGVEFGTCERDFVGFAFTAVAGFGKFGTATGRRRDVIAGAGSHQLGHF